MASISWGMVTSDAGIAGAILILKPTLSHRDRSVAFHQCNCLSNVKSPAYSVSFILLTGPENLLLFVYCMLLYEQRISTNDTKI